MAKIILKIPAVMRHSFPHLPICCRFIQSPIIQIEVYQITLQKEELRQIASILYNFWAIVPNSVCFDRPSTPSQYIRGPDFDIENDFVDQAGVFSCAERSFD